MKQLDFSHMISPSYEVNLERAPCMGSEYPCILCGRAVKKPKHAIWVHLGGGVAVTADEGERLNAAGQGGADLGEQPIGADCLKKHPELKPFLVAKVSK